MQRQRLLKAIIIDGILTLVLGAILAFLYFNNYPESVLIPVLIGGVVLTSLPFTLAALSPARNTWQAQTLLQSGAPGTAEVLEDGEQIAAAALRGMENYQGPEILIDVPVYVQPTTDPLAYRSTMKAGVSSAGVLKPGVKVMVKYDPQHKERVVLNDTAQAIVERNAILRRDEDAW